MVAGCGNNMLKYILLFLNFLIFIMAMVGIVASLVFILKPGTIDEVGTAVKDFKEMKDTLSEATIKAGLYVILATSIIILIISFLGCCGAWKEIKFLLGLYATVLLLILIAEIAAFVLAIVFKSNVEKKLKETLKLVKNKNETIFGDIEKILKCCGINESDSCVAKDTSKITTEAPKIGCYDRILELLKSFYTLILVVSIITVAVEIFLISFSCCLCSNIGEVVA